MKLLQNDFTTPEQSKRLLELGVPEWTANWHLLDLGLGDYSEPRYGAGDYENGDIPCWSVGRLIEIYDLFGVCTTPQYCENYLEELVLEFESLVKNNGFDFSKLEN